MADNGKNPTPIGGYQPQLVWTPLILTAVGPAGDRARAWKARVVLPGVEPVITMEYHVVTTKPSALEQPALWRMQIEQFQVRADENGVEVLEAIAGPPFAVLVDAKKQLMPPDTLMAVFLEPTGLPDHFLLATQVGRVNTGGLSLT